MKMISFQPANNQLSSLTDGALNGENRMLAEVGKPLIMQDPGRVGGQFRGQIWEAPDCWADGEDLLFS
ncbi:hypothetical protein WJU23_14725 [Prosthecobacter sp. SYSU 5D2]|uniref:hypothetical protein n=1 Tax=Prosthecobacter sp. SYSU 5D2 TaxID=3134134 RepID=UPI0031FEF772